MLKIIYDSTFLEDIYNISLKNHYTTISKENIKKYINDKYHKVIIKIDNDIVVGFSIYFILAPEIDILFIATYPENYGYGSEIIEYIFNDAIKNKIENIKLELDYTNKNALIFYKKNGFKEIAIRKKYYNNKNDAIIMEKIFIY